MARRARIADLPFIGALDRGSRDLSKQLAEALRGAIRRSDLRGGEVLPSTRVLAQALGIARGTVVEAGSEGRDLSEVCLQISDNLGEARVVDGV